MQISNEELEILNRAGEILLKYAGRGGLTRSDYERYDKMVISIIDALGEEAVEMTIPSKKVDEDSVLYTGIGDEVIELKSIPYQHVFEVNGNFDKKYFGIIAYDKNAKRLNSIVNTTDVYHGIVMEQTQTEAVLEIRSQGKWEIKALSISQLSDVQKGTSISGIGDSIFCFSPESGESVTAQVSGNHGNKYFGVIGYTKDLKRIAAYINTTDEYNGKILLHGNPRVFEIKATGSWTIRFL